MSDPVEGNAVSTAAQGGEEERRDHIGDYASVPSSLPGGQTTMIPTVHAEVVSVAEGQAEVDSLVPHPRSEDLQLRELQLRLMDQEQQMQEQRQQTMFLGRILSQQMLMNEEQARMNQRMMVESSPDGRSCLSLAVPASVSASAAASRAADGSSISQLSAERTNGCSGSRQTAATMARTAPVPSTAVQIISAVKRRILLPRDEEVQRVVDSLLSTRTRDNGGVGSPSEENSLNRVHTSQADVHDEDEIPTSRPNDEAVVGISREESDAANWDQDGSDASMSLLGSSSYKGQLFNPSQFNTIVRGMGGIGKTIVAALTVSRRDVLSHFHDGIAWIKLGQRRSTADWTSSGGSDGDDGATPVACLSYQDYTDHLCMLCAQIGVFPPEFEEVVLHPGDDDCIRKRKAIRAIEAARNEMIHLLARSSVLIVLDDVWYDSDIDWFVFGRGPTSRVRLLVTTRLKVGGFGSGLPAGPMGSGGAGTVIDLCALGEDDAVQLLLAEATCESSSAQIGRRSWTAEERLHALTIVRGCGCLPVAVRSAGRLLSAALAAEELMGGNAISIEELASKLSSGNSQAATVYGSDGLGRALSDRGDCAMYEIMDRCFSPNLHAELATAAKVCFTAFAVVFSRADCARPFVPITAIRLLWEGILHRNERSILGRNRDKSFVAQLLEKMETLGLIDSAILHSPRCSHSQRDVPLLTQRDILSYRVHHDMMLQYAIRTLENDDALDYRVMNHRFRMNKLVLKGTHSSSPKRFSRLGKSGRKHEKKHNRQSKLLEQLHLLLARKYEGNRDKTPDQLWDMFKNDDYIFHHLPRHLVEAGGSALCKKALDLLRDDGFIQGRVAAMGIEHGVKAHVLDAEAAINRFRNATCSKRDKSFLKDEIVITYDALCSFLWKMISTESSDTCEEVGRAFVAVATSLQKQALWIHSLDRLAEALKIYEKAGIGSDHPDVVRTTRHVDATSLPNLSLVPRDSDKCIRFKNAAKLREYSNVHTNRTELEGAGKGISMELSSHPGLAVVSMRPQYSSCLVTEVMQLGIGPKENALHVCRTGESIQRSSDGGVLAVGSTCVNGHNVYLMSPRSEKQSSEFAGYRFRVNEDDTISPSQNRELALGIGSFQIVLVPRSSPNRLIFEHGRKICDCRLGKVGYNPTTKLGLPLELSSHPGQAVTVQTSSPVNTGPARFCFLGIGPASSALKVLYDGRIVASSENGAVLRVGVADGWHYEINSPLLLFRANGKSATTWKGGVNDFVINEEGSISPKHAPNVALGCACLGLANDIVSSEQKAHAEAQARLRPKKQHLVNKTRVIQLKVGVAIHFDASKFWLSNW